MIDHYYAVIMAGGGGTRLWPLSRQSRPKQMLRLGGGETLFQQAVSRLGGLFPPERILVVTVEDQAAQLQQQAPQIPVENYLLEPMPRGTASVVGLGAVVLQSRDPQAVMAILTADHFIKNVDAFQQILRKACLVAQAGYLVTLGIQPTYPATGYGYIQQGDLLSVDETRAYRVERFKEKPDEVTARRLLDQGDHVWNSGMFVWRTDRIMEEFQRQMPELNVKLTDIATAWGTPEQEKRLQSVWPTIQPQTIDYGIMEHADRVAVLPAGDLGWSDVGSWESLFDVLPANSDGNILIGGTHMNLDSTSSLVLSENPQRLIVTIGVEDLVVVDTGNALLIARRDESQRVKDVVQRLKETGSADYL